MKTQQPFEEPLVRRPTVCRICGHQFKGSALSSAAIVGDNPAAKIQHVANLMKPLMEHMAKDKLHQEALRAAQTEGGKLAGLLTINYFDCDDPGVERARDETRWQIFQTMRRVKITDERIEERLSQTVLAHLKSQGMEDQEADAFAYQWMHDPLARAILETMRAMRDAIEETGRYNWPKFAPAQTEESKPAETEPQTAPQS